MKVIVVGGGQVGRYISSLLLSNGHEIKVIARVNNPKNAWLFNSGMGVDVGVNQADLMAHLIVEEMNLEDMITLMKLNRGEYSIVQI